ncbi:MAG: hypothetical protein K0S47_210 [Herbinix sp.]|jgi:hypothetical protein|nr:hypothetical protein [Herbinix sp.]
MNQFSSYSSEEADQNDQNRPNTNTQEEDVESQTLQIQQQAPMSAPPSFSPPSPMWHSGPQGIGRCINRNTYIWLMNGNSFWFFPVFVGRQAVVGFRWRGFGWSYQRINFRNILSYRCF